jgi:hypothetical protein
MIVRGELNRFSPLRQSREVARTGDVFCTDALFIRAENTVGARSAQWSLLACGGVKTPHSELK